ncbi:hypothetical protein [Devosia sp. Leaf64]|uniref:hypothetical protein n=1 Tax=Devosia sp. Leaf64 TaxID=1736229 RepID=UPI0012E198C9|nr:hypothetical protein [Devosia sp. Leaf64]
MFGRVFKTRSADRDLEADQKRVSLVTSAIGKAIDEYERERAGLQARVQSFHAIAVSITDHSDFETRDVVSEGIAATSEVQASLAIKRLHRIESNVDKLREIQNVLELHFK